jgi:hypothetical protein
VKGKVFAAQGLGAIRLPAHLAKQTQFAPARVKIKVLAARTGKRSGGDAQPTKRDPKW